MSLTPLTKPWFHAPAGHEKIWLGCAVLWCFVMSLMMPYWHFRGKQNSTGEAGAQTQLAHAGTPRNTAPQM